MTKYNLRTMNTIYKLEICTNLGWHPSSSCVLFDSWIANKEKQNECLSKRMVTRSQGLLEITCRRILTWIIKMLMLATILGKVKILMRWITSLGRLLWGGIDMIGLFLDDERNPEDVTWIKYPR